MGIFDGLAAALAALIGTTSDVAGFILGIVTIVVITVVVTWALGEHAKGSAVFIPVGIGYVFCVLVGWFPIWTVIFIALVLVLVIVKPFGSSDAGGM